LADTTLKDLLSPSVLRKQGMKDILLNLLSLRKVVIHTVLYVIYSMWFDVFPKIREIQVQKSMKSSRARNPGKILSSLAAKGPNKL
jgi:hypothetical protein